jgi:hypothetical protein
MKILKLLKTLMKTPEAQTDHRPGVDESGGFITEFPTGWKFIPIVLPECCAECRFSGPIQGYDEIPCQRHAPVSEKVDPARDLRQWVPRFPIMRAAEWCGDFERRPVKVD